MKPTLDLSSIRGIVFDAVGTLIEPHPMVAEVYVSAARRRGIELDTILVKQRFRRHFGRMESAEEANPFATDEPNERRRWQRVVAGCLPEISDPDIAFLELWDHFADPASWIVFPDVSAAIRRFREADFRVCIASNFDGRLHQVAEGLPELKSWCEPLVVSSEVLYRKPHPAFYQAASRQLGLDRSEVLFVGDDLENDYVGPRRAGFQALLIHRDENPHPEAHSVRDLNELTEFLLNGGNEAANVVET